MDCLRAVCREALSSIKQLGAARPGLGERTAQRNRGHVGFVPESRTPGSLSFAPKVLPSSLPTSVGNQPCCAEEIHPCPVAVGWGLAPCVPHLPYTQHVCVMQGIKTSKAASGRRFVICFVSIPEMKMFVLCQGSWPGAELGKDPVFSGGQSSEHCWGFPREESRSSSWHWAFPSPPHIPLPCAELSPISLVSLAPALPVTFLLTPSGSATSPAPPPSKPSLYHQKITLAPSLSANGCLSAVSLKRSPKPGLENSPSFI